MATDSKRQERYSKFDAIDLIRDQLKKDNPQHKIVQGYIRELKCPQCGINEAWTRLDSPFYIKCPRENKCGATTKITDIYPDLFKRAGVKKPEISKSFEYLKGRGIKPEFFSYSFIPKIQRDKKNYPVVTFPLWPSNQFHTGRLITNDKIKNKGWFKKGSHPSKSIYISKELKKGEEVYIAESCLDAMSLTQSDFQAISVLSAGYNFSNNTALEQLSKKGYKFVIAFDNDPAGIKGVTKMKRALSLFGAEYRVVYPPEGKDWNDLLIEGCLTTDNMFPESEVVIPQDEDPDWKFWLFDEDKKKYVLDSIKFLSFLKSRGFYFYRDKLSDNYVFVKITKKCVCEKVTEEQIKTYVVNLLRRKGSEEGIQFVHRSGSFWFSRASLNVVELIDLNLLKDTRDASYIVFKNCVLEIDKHGFHKHSYNYLVGNGLFVWKDQIIKRDFDINESESIFSDFLSNTCRYMLIKDDSKKDDSRKDDSEENMERKFDETAYNSVSSAIGYLIHTYQDPSNPRAIIFVDRDPEEGEEDGRRGKGVVLNAVAQVRDKAPINGKGLDVKNRFAYQNVTHTTQFVVIDDIGKNFKFESIFSLISEGFQAEGKGANRPLLVFEPEDSPKIAITSNTVLKGVGSSHSARQLICEFSDFYDDEVTPYSVHGCNFFTDDWDSDEWNRFYTFLARCTRDYIQNGLVKAEDQLYEYNKAIEMVGEEFFLFLEGNLKINYLHPKKDLFENFKREYPQYNNFSSQNLGKRLKHFCKIKKYIVNAHRKGQKDTRDVRSGIEYITLTREQEKEPTEEPSTNFCAGAIPTEISNT